MKRKRHLTVYPVSPPPPAGGCLSLPSGSGGVSPTVCGVLILHSWLRWGSVASGEEGRGDAQAPRPCPAVGCEPRCAEEVTSRWVSTPSSPHSMAWSWPQALPKSSGPRPRPPAPGNGPAALQELPTVSFTRSRACGVPSRQAAHRHRAIVCSRLETRRWEPGGGDPSSTPTCWRTPPLGSDAREETGPVAAGPGHRQRGAASGQGRPRPPGSQAPRPWPLSGEGLTC